METRVKEASFFLSRLDRLLISGLVFLVPAFKVLLTVLICSSCLAWIYTVLSTRILDDS